MTRRRIKTLKQLENLAEGTILIQVYHKHSSDGSRFDINQKQDNAIILLAEVGGQYRYKHSKRATLEDTALRLKDVKRVYIYVAEKWLQELY